MNRWTAGHPRPHGSRQRYLRGAYGSDTANGCRCIPCTDANTANQRQRRRRLADEAGGSVDPYFALAEHARNHLRWLKAQGVGLPSVERVTGLRKITLYAIRSGRQTRILFRTSDAILACNVSRCRVANELVPVEPTRRLIDELIAHGHTTAALAGLLGYQGRALQFLHHPMIKASRARQVAALHAELMRPVLVDRERATERRRYYRGTYHARRAA